MIDQSKTYRTRTGKAVRIYATNCGEHWPIHGAVETETGWRPRSWKANGKQTIGYLEDVDDLIESDPHGILPRHRELLAEAMVEHKHDFRENVEIVRTGSYAALLPAQHVALIALARLEKEKGE